MYLPGILWVVQTAVEVHLLTHYFLQLFLFLKTIQQHIAGHKNHEVHSCLKQRLSAIDIRYCDNAIKRVQFYTTPLLVAASFWVLDVLSERAPISGNSSYLSSSHLLDGRRWIYTRPSIIGQLLVTWAGQQPSTSCSWDVINVCVCVCVLF